MTDSLFSFLEGGEPPLQSTLRPKAAMTPMMAQYTEIKAVNPGYLLFYRMGDFYELFFEDAEVASRALGITLTKRGKHLEEDIPMCGVPFHAAEDYLHRLIALGHKVAICEQLEDPAEAKKRGAKSVVKRDVVRLVTPGTLTEDALLQPGKNNYLAALANSASKDGGQQFALAWLDLSTGAFSVTQLEAEGLAGELARITPSELILPQSLHDTPELLSALRFGGTLTPMVNETFHPKRGEERIVQFYEVASSDAFGGFSGAEKAAAGALIAYVERTQLGAKPALQFPSRELRAQYMRIDAATRANLELSETMKGKRDGSLLATIDETLTATGGRLLAGWLAAPLLDVSEIEARQQVVSAFCASEQGRRGLRSALSGVPDMARSLSRLSLGRAGPRDLGAFAQGLTAVHPTLQALESLGEGAMPTALQTCLEALKQSPEGLAHTLQSALKDELPMLARDGGFVACGFAPELDEAVSLKEDTRAVIARLQADYVSLTGIKGLKIKHNNVLGYFIEVPASLQERMTSLPLSEHFYHRQTLANVARFSSEKLGELEGKIASAAERVRAIETQVFDDLVYAVLCQRQPLQNLIDALAKLDVLSSLAELAVKQRWARPEITSDLSFEIAQGRHPVVEAALRKQGQQFAANDCALTDGRIYVVTGPNMAGKSTYLRQNALLAILAQMGSFVPAESAKIGIIDQVFCRVGAADDLAMGRSTFMVEMVETAAILNQASQHSLVILDEIGRGTATYDGLSIAQAALESLHNVTRCRGLFATHYHELTRAMAEFARLENVSVSVREWGGDIVFLHKVVQGPADRSYGIQVARLAGLPRHVIARAQTLLSQYEAHGTKSLPTQSASAANQDVPQNSALQQALMALKPDDLSPREALEMLYNLKALSALEPAPKPAPTSEEPKDALE